MTLRPPSPPPHYLRHHHHLLLHRPPPPHHHRLYLRAALPISTTRLPSWWRVRSWRTLCSPGLCRPHDGSRCVGFYIQHRGTPPAPLSTLITPQPPPPPPVCPFS